MKEFVAEFVGTTLLILLGNGVVANTILSKSKGNNGGWIVITVGWAIAVFVGVYSAIKLGSQAHLNPIVTMVIGYLNNFSLQQIFIYISGQFLGAMFGAFLVWVVYKLQFDETESESLILASFCTSPAIKNIKYNLLSEVVATTVLILGILLLTKSEIGFGSLDALPVSLLILGIGLSLGGSTGYAINPARDFGPRIIHAILPIKKQRV